ncbi:MAG: LD-carboxypeptidase [Alphaproteobacteria bacterium]|nr:LD-carboxypeptidase [Alphaproteobacteria bacterium]
MIRVAVCAPSTPLKTESIARVRALAEADFPGVELHFHPQCEANEGHFAGPDEVRLAALLECANDPAFDAVWFARGGYGACRIAEAAIAGMDHAATQKAYLGYSDAGYLLAGLYRAGIGRPVHAPMPMDMAREGGEVAVNRVLAWLAGDKSTLEPSLDHRLTVAFNLMTLAMVCGTPLMPGLAGHVVMLEEVSEHFYSVDRLFFHVSAHLGGIAGLRMGRVSDVPENDRDFRADGQDIARYWCERHAIPYLGSADIGHDNANRIVPFGLARGAKGQ